MSWDFLLWIFVFILQAALLGKGMFTLITLGDLESDHTNPFDCSVAVNRFVVRALQLSSWHLLDLVRQGRRGQHPCGTDLRDRPRWVPPCLMFRT